MASPVIQLGLRPVTVRIRWFDANNFQMASKPPDVVFFDVAKGPHAKIESHSPNKERDQHIWDYVLKVPREKMLIGCSVGDQTTVFQIAPDTPEGRTVDIPINSVRPKTQGATIRILAQEEYVPTHKDRPEKKPLEGVTVSAELFEVSKDDKPKKPGRAKESPISSTVTQGEAELDVGATGLYKVSVAPSRAQAACKPSLPLWVFVSSGEVVDLVLLFEAFERVPVGEGEISGNFVYEGGKPLADRPVKVVSKETGRLYEERTKKDGSFKLSVPKGQYEVSAEAPSSDFDVPTMVITV